MKNLLTYLGASLGLALWFSNATAAPVDDIVAKANHAAYYQADSGRARVDMVITDKAGRKNKRRFTILRKDVDQHTDAQQKFYILFHKPSDVKNTTFMVWKHIAKADDRWLYLPALDLVKRIAASDTRTSFVGSHFYYEDVSGRGLSADKHELMADINQRYQVKSTPKKPDSVEFAYYITQIDQQTFLPMKTQYFDASDQLIREFEALKVEQISGYNMVTHSVMKDLNSGGNTQMKYRKIQFNTSLPDKVFTERSLRKTPTKYLK